jgi:hypothetical protein
VKAERSNSILEEGKSNDENDTQDLSGTSQSDLGNTIAHPVEWLRRFVAAIYR